MISSWLGSKHHVLTSPVYISDSKSKVLVPEISSESALQLLWGGAGHSDQPACKPTPTVRRCFCPGLQRERASRRRAVCRTGAVHGTAKKCTGALLHLFVTRRVRLEDYQEFGVSLGCGNRSVSSGERHYLLVSPELSFDSPSLFLKTSSQTMSFACSMSSSMTHLSWSLLYLFHSIWFLPYILLLRW